MSEEFGEQSFSTLLYERNFYVTNTCTQLSEINILACYVEAPHIDITSRQNPTFPKLY
jgi:hypothetical protein